MLNKNKIIFVSLVDNRNRIYKDLSIRLWSHEKMIKNLLLKENCVIGRRTYDLTKWKGPNSWVLTRNLKWKSVGIGTIHSIEDFHLWMNGDIYIIGGSSIFQQLEKYVDEIKLFVFNSTNLTDDNKEIEWIKIDMNDWIPTDYVNKRYWSYANLIKCKK